jgi:hypothetical protein
MFFSESFVDPLFDQVYVYGAVPPEINTIALPFLSPLHLGVTIETEDIVKLLQPGAAQLNDSTIVQLLESVTVTAYAPLPTLEIEAVVAICVFVPSTHLNVYGLVPPEGVTVAFPSNGLLTFVLQLLVVDAVN